MPSPSLRVSPNSLRPAAHPRMHAALPLLPHQREKVAAQPPDEAPSPFGRRWSAAGGPDEGMRTSTRRRPRDGALHALTPRIAGTSPRGRGGRCSRALPFLILSLVLFAPTARADTLRIVAYDAHGLGDPGSAELDAQIRVIESMAPDVLLLQSANGDAGRAALLAYFGTSLPHSFLGAINPGAGPARTMVMSRFPILASGNINAAGTNHPTPWTDLDLNSAAPGPELRVYSMHWFAGFSEAQVAAKTAMALAVTADVAAVLKGDPDRPIIVGGTTHEQPTQSVNLLMYAPAFPDLFIIDQVDPFTGSAITHWELNQNHDHFFVTDNVASELIESVVYNTGTYEPAPPAPALPGDADLASEHWPIILDFNLALGPALFGDLNGDCVVDTADLGLLISQFGQPGGAGVPADLNGDGEIDTADLGQLLGAFGTECPV